MTRRLYWLTPIAVVALSSRLWAIGAKAPMARAIVPVEAAPQLPAAMAAGLSAAAPQAMAEPNPEPNSAPTSLSRVGEAFGLSEEESSRPGAPPLALEARAGAAFDKSRADAPSGGAAGAAPQGPVTGKALDPSRRSAAVEAVEAQLRGKIIGQEEAVEKVIQAYQIFTAGLNAPGRPVSNLLFLGPTGSGKTRVVEALAETLFGHPGAMIKIDCAEYQHSHEIAKLIGSPPGYLGHRETHPAFTQEALNQWHTDTVKLSLVLFDEIEKASDALWQLLLGILDKATLTLGDNRKVDFSQTMIFMTSNLGAAEMRDLVSKRLGFTPPSAEDKNAADPNLHGKIDRVAREAARRKFSPEFMNRLDKVVVFHSLETEHLDKILDIELNAVKDRVAKAQNGKGVQMELTTRARAFLLHEGTSQEYGARHLKRAIERHLVYPMANLIATGQLGAGDRVDVDVDPSGEGLSFLKP